MRKKSEKDTILLATELTVPAKAECINKVRKLILDICKKANFGEEETQDLCLATSEAVTNAIRHSKSKNLNVSVKINDYCITVKVTDNGCGFTFSKEKCRFPSIDELGGRGLPIINSLVDQLTVDSQAGCGTSVTMVKHVNKKHPKKELLDKKNKHGNNSSNKLINIPAS